MGLSGCFVNSFRRARTSSVLGYSEMAYCWADMIGSLGCAPHCEERGLRRSNLRAPLGLRRILRLRCASLTPYPRSGGAPGGMLAMTLTNVTLRRHSSRHAPLSVDLCG